MAWLTSIRSQRRDAKRGGPPRLATFGGASYHEPFVPLAKPGEQARRFKGRLLMFSPDMYQLLDFGDGRRLERFGPWCLDRPSPSAEPIARNDPRLWLTADARFDRAEGQEGRWRDRHALPARWTIRHERITLELKRTEVGHLGLFPEQAACWDWIARQVGESQRGMERLRVLNLFAYTGGSTLTAAAAGAGGHPCGFGSQRGGLGSPQRRAFRPRSGPNPLDQRGRPQIQRREVKRGRQYDAVILDPPSYGHGPKGEVWRLEHDLPELLELCGLLTAERRRFVLLTCHTPEFGPERLAHLLNEALDGGEPGTIEAGELTIPAASGRVLPSGVVVRWTARRTQP